MNHTSKYLNYLKHLKQSIPEHASLIESIETGFRLCFESTSDKYGEYRTHGTVNGDDLPDAPRVRERRPSEMWRTRMSQEMSQDIWPSKDNPSADPAWKFAQDADIDDDIEHTHFEELAQKNYDSRISDDMETPSLDRMHSDAPYTLGDKWTDEDDRMHSDAPYTLGDKWNDKNTYDSEHHLDEYRNNPHFVPDKSKYANSGL